MLVEDGELLTGILCKRSIGASLGSIIHIIALELGQKETGAFIYHIQTVANNWLLYEGHSIGVEDFIADEKTYIDIRKVIREAKVGCNKIRETNQKG